MGLRGKEREIEFKKVKNGRYVCYECTSHSKDSGGYPLYHYCTKDGVQHTTTLHRLLYMKKYGRIPKGKLVLHICDNRACINLKHLKIGTYSDNIQDCLRKKRFNERKGMPRIKLTADQVRLIRKSKEHKKVLAMKFCVALITIWRIQNFLSRKGIV